MTVKERLHHLVEALPETELETAARVLEALHATADPVAWALDNAPDNDDVNGGLTEARAEMAAGHTIPRRQIAATDRQINRLVYELYVLTDEEIGIVEGSQRSSSVRYERPQMMQSRESSGSM